MDLLTCNWLQQSTGEVFAIINADHLDSQPKGSKLLLCVKQARPPFNSTNAM